MSEFLTEKNNSCHVNDTVNNSWEYETYKELTSSNYTRADFTVTTNGEKKIAKLILKAKKYLAEKSPSTESTFTMIFCGMHIISK